MNNLLEKVTILILIDGFLQYKLSNTFSAYDAGHNPYFNRWFSAIHRNNNKMCLELRHNPYFNRWFSAITDNQKKNGKKAKSQSLF